MAGPKELSPDSHMPDPLMRASAIELAMEAMQLASDAGPDTAFVPNSPATSCLSHSFSACSAEDIFVLAATLESPSANNHLPNDCQDAYLNADFLLKTGAMQVWN